MTSHRSRLFLSLLLATSLALTGCVTSEESLPEEGKAQSETPAPEVTEAAEEERGMPDWVLGPSPANIDLCRVPDGQPPELQVLPRGVMVNGHPLRGSVGFPFVPDRFPTLGTARIVLGAVAFEDAPPTTDTAREFFSPHAKKMGEWADFWSQGQFAFDITIIDEWIQVPRKSVDMPSDDRQIAGIVQSHIPETVDLSGIDGTFIYWAEGTDGGNRHDFGVRVGSNENTYGDPASRPDLFWAVAQYHIEDTGNGIPLSLKTDYIWSYLIHEIQHEQGLNTHSPGNGWQTGVGQNQYPDPGTGQWSAALASWELFLLGWISDEQVHCIDPENLDAPENFILTAQEVYGGERKIAVVPISGSDVLVVESRRPIGWTAGWDSRDIGLLVYTVNPEVEFVKDHEGDDCGNTPEIPKWSYYLYVDGKAPAVCDYNQLDRVLVREGETVTHEGIRVRLEYSADEVDYVTIEAVTP